LLVLISRVTEQRNRDWAACAWSKFARAARLFYWQACAWSEFVCMTALLACAPLYCRPYGEHQPSRAVTSSHDWDTRSLVHPSPSCHVILHPFVASSDHHIVISFALSYERDHVYDAFFSVITIPASGFALIASATASVLCETTSDVQLGEGTLDDALAFSCIVSCT
jgi:hypothetical protein